MALSPQLRMDLRNVQSMVMTPALSQAIALLQMTNLELSAYVEEQIAQNPFLEKVESDGASNAAAANDEAAPTDLTHQPNDVREAYEAAPEDKSGDGVPDTNDGVYDEPQDNYSQVCYAEVGSGGNTDFSEDDRQFDATLSKPQTLREHLQQQVAVSFEDAKDAALAGWLVDALDESGYLRQDPRELAAQLNVDEERLNRVLAELKQFDPTGVFAHDLTECLRLQLEEQDLYDKEYAALLANLPLLAGHELKKLGQACGLDQEDLKERVAHLKTLNPKPASSFDQLVVQTALPDAMMTKMPKSQGGGWRVELNNDTLPKVLINNSYVAEIERGGGKETKSYISAQLANANWLIKAMDQRAQSVLAIASAIVEMQEGFFLYGIEYLKTMTLKDIAEEVGVHESTVSRIVNGKFIATPRGLFELKFFFSSGVMSAEGQDVAAEAVKAKIKTLIDNEGKAVLSDDALTDALVKDGINVARRTVAKYREALGFPSSFLRRRQKSG